MSAVQSFFIITGKETKTGKLVYLAWYHSGGHHYWTDRFDWATKFETLTTASKTIGRAGHMIDQASDVKINRVSIVIEEVPTLVKEFYYV
jgi:hypothetical protein